MRVRISWVFLLIVMLLCLSQRAMAQFGSGVEGTVRDSSGAIVGGAQVKLTDMDTQVSQTRNTDDGGNFRFLSLAPGPYVVTVTRTSFAETNVPIQLLTDQMLNVPVTLNVSSQSSSVSVTAEAPTLDTADSRSESTLSTTALTQLPLQGRNMISLVTTAPGVTGIGTVAGGTPGSAVDNFSTETQVDASANGRSSAGNLYIVDGLDVTSDIRPGVLNVTPNPDAIQEATVQTNTFTVDYGRASSIQMVMTTRSGSDQYHGNASDYYTNQDLWSRTEFTQKYLPFSVNNISATLGGPIVPHHQAFFFFAVEPLRSTASSGSVVSYEDPAFITYATQTYPNSLGAQIMSKYTVAHVIETGSPILASTLFPGTCGTAATNDLPCSLAMLDRGNFTSSSYRNGIQYHARIDKYWSKDRLYGSFFRTTTETSTPDPRPAFDSTDRYNSFPVQVNETHTFSATTLNEAQFGFNRSYGITPATGLFSVPVINVVGENGYGDGFALGNFTQHNYHWRDVLTHVLGAHVLKFGYDGWHGDNLFDGKAAYEQPTFQFNNLLDLAESDPYTESGLAYSPLTGQANAGFSFFYHNTTAGGFFEDAWRVNSRLNINYGIRYDDFGNATPEDGSVATNFILGPGATFDDQVANGVLRKQNAVLNSSIKNNWSPRVGFAYDVTGKGSWVLRGGFGVYHDWPTLGQLSEAVALYGSPYSFVVPTFFNNGTTTSTPIFSLGQGNSPPFGYPYPAIGTTTISPSGGLTGTQISIGGIDPLLKAPSTYNYTATLAHSVARNLVASVAYVGSTSSDLISGSAYANTVNAVATGVDINRFAGDLIANDGVLTRLNPSFGTIYYMNNGAAASFNALVLALQGRFGARGFVSASYTRSRAYDDASQYATATDLHQYWGPSNTDAPNRLSLSWNYLLPGRGQGAVGRLTNGWSVSAVTTLQSGYPFTVYTSAPFEPIFNAQGQVVGEQPGGGDYNADGVDLDYPNVPNYSQPTSRQAYLSGLFPASNFTPPTLGTEGNELVDRFRGPGFANTDFSLLKSTAINERCKLDFRVDFFNVFNRPNLSGMVSDLSSPSFATATSQYNPRWIEFSANFRF